MAENLTVSNEFSSFIIEAIEPKEIKEQLILRQQNLPDFKLLGPPDLCYIIREKTVTSGFKKKTIQHGFFHYVYGVNTSSQALIALYLNQLS